MLQLLADTYDYTTTNTTTNTGASMGLVLFYLIVAVVAIVAMWKLFTKAGKPGWAAIVPIYNGWVLAEIAGRPGWWGLLLLIPFVNIVVSLVLALDIAKRFGKSPVFGVVALWLFSLVGYLILGFGDAKYQSAPASEASAPTV